jgi:hypothetical protein
VLSRGETAVLALQGQEFRLLQVGDGCGCGIEQHQPQLAVEPRIWLTQAFSQICKEVAQLEAKSLTHGFTTAG